jgi:hypothetical protein
MFKNKIEKKNESGSGCDTFVILLQLLYDTV